MTTLLVAEHNGDMAGHRGGQPADAGLDEDVGGGRGHCFQRLVDEDRVALHHQAGDMFIAGPRGVSPPIG